MDITPERLEQIRLAVEHGYHQYLSKQGTNKASAEPAKVKPSPFGRTKSLPMQIKKWVTVGGVDMNHDGRDEHHHGGTPMEIDEATGKIKKGPSGTVGKTPAELPKQQSSDNQVTSKLTPEPTSPIHAISNVAEQSGVLSKADARRVREASTLDKQLYELSRADTNVLDKFFSGDNALSDLAQQHDLYHNEVIRSLDARFREWQQGMKSDGDKDQLKRSLASIGERAQAAAAALQANGESAAANFYKQQVPALIQEISQQVGLTKKSTATNPKVPAVKPSPLIQAGSGSVSHLPQPDSSVPAAVAEKLQKLAEEKDVDGLLKAYPSPYSYKANLYRFQLIESLLKAGVRGHPNDPVPDLSLEQHHEKMQQLADKQKLEANKILKHLKKPELNYELRVMPIDAVLPSQSGEDYINDSSIELAKHIRSFGSSGRKEDYAPIVVDEQGNIIDGNHRHAARLMAGVTTIPVLWGKKKL